jgi:hypothetical protein
MASPAPARPSAALMTRCAQAGARMSCTRNAAMLGAPLPASVSPAALIANVAPTTTSVERGSRAGPPAKICTLHSARASKPTSVPVTSPGPGLRSAHATPVAKRTTSTTTAGGIRRASDVARASGSRLNAMTVTASADTRPPRSNRAGQRAFVTGAECRRLGRTRVALRIARRCCWASLRSRPTYGSGH